MTTPYKIASLRSVLLVQLALAVAVFCASCVPAEQKCYNEFKSFVVSVEQDADQMSAEEWKACMEAYKFYVQDLDSYSRRYTPEQNREIGRMKARFHKLTVSRYVNRASDIVNSVTSQIGGYSEELGSNGENNVGSAVENITSTVGKISDLFNN